MTYTTYITILIKKIILTGFIGWFSVFAPSVAMAQETQSETTTDATQSVEETQTTTETVVEEECTGNGCGQGENQGVDQGVDLGGPTLEDLGGTTDETGNEILPEGTVDTRQGAQQGADQGATLGISGSNTNTGSDSTNSVDADVSDSNTSTTSNASTDTTSATATASTGSNTANQNTGVGTVQTGNANIGVTQVKNDNTTTQNGTATASVSGHHGTYEGDLELAFADAVSLLTGTGDSRSIRAINDTTGSGSTNEVLLSTLYEDITEVQNDGEIDNTVDVNAITGQNSANQNTSGGSIETGDANIAATLVNLLNTTVINGNLSLSVHDIFGDLVGDIRIPDLGQLAALLGSPTVNVDASNDTTGSDSTNDIDVTVRDTETTTVTNDADVDTTINANAITGQNETLDNTMGGNITTGDGSVSGSNLTIANTTVEGGNWGLVVVNALNRWLGFLVGDSGEVRQLSQEETIREIEARNSNTGSDSTNTIDITDETNTETTVANNARIRNTINADAITGQNEANENTKGANILTGDANVLATVVNVANTTVLNANLGIAVVNIFGNWFGDLLYGGQSLLAGAGGGTQADVSAQNNQTGSNSDNTIDVTIEQNHETNIDNDADINTVLNANVDTGTNRANRNTVGGNIQTGDGFLALHSRAIANLTGISDGAGLSVNVLGGNNTTGVDSENRINANVNNERVVNITNTANVSTLFPASINTGNNEASDNTVGGNIETGDAAANISIQNLLNQLMLALGTNLDLAGLGTGGSVHIHADLMNYLTGSDSVNENNLGVVHGALLNMFNNAFVNNLVDLILNTGGNIANRNTVGGSISTGKVCVDGKIENDVNSYSTSGTTSADILNLGTVNNDVDVQGSTGGNESEHNTLGDDIQKDEGLCDKIAKGPEESPTPTPTPKPDDGGNGGDNGGGNGGGDDDGDNGEEEKKENGNGGGAGGDGNGGNGDSEGRVAGVSESAPAAKELPEKISRLAFTGFTDPGSVNWSRVVLWILLATAGVLTASLFIRRDNRTSIATT